MSYEIIELSNYQRKEIEEVKSKGYVTYGENNSAFTELIRLSKESPTNSAVIKGLNRLVYGKGLAAKNSGGSNAAMFAKAMSMISPIELHKGVVDENIMANVVFLVTRSMNGETAKIQHIPTQMVAPSIVNKDGEITHYNYSSKFGVNDISIVHEEQIEVYPNFDLDPKAEKSIKYIKSYTPGSWYFNDPEYQGSIEYMEVEIENGKYHVNNVKGKFSAQTSITMFNGDPGKDKREKTKRAIKKEYSGSDGNTLMVNFVDRDGTAPKIEALPVRDLHMQQAYIGTESTEKILLGHGVSMASMIFGIKGGTGLGNNAEEMETSFVLMNNMTIIPKQNKIIEGLEDIFRYYDITLDFYFKSLKPNEFIDIGVVPKVDEEEQALSKQPTELDKFIALGSDDSEFDGFDLVSDEPIDYDTYKTDEFSPVKLSVIDRAFILLGRETKTVTARGNSNSRQDSDDILIRYNYRGNTTGEREFCVKMLKAKKNYRIEDIEAMETVHINPAFEHNKKPYSILELKGGQYCHHQWFRKIYLRKDVKIDVNSPLAETISVAQARRKGYEIPVNNPKMGIKTINQPGRGEYPG